MTNYINPKKLILIAISFTMLLILPLTVLACEKKTILELKYMEKNRLIKFACHAETDIKFYKNSADTTKKVVDKFANSLDEIVYGAISDNYLFYLEELQCSKNNFSKSKDVLRKDHGINVRNFTQKYCTHDK